MNWHCYLLINLWLGWVVSHLNRLVDENQFMYFSLEFMIIENLDTAQRLWKIDIWLCSYQFQDIVWRISHVTFANFNFSKRHLCVFHSDWSVRSQNVLLESLCIKSFLCFFLCIYCFIRVSIIRSNKMFLVRKFLFSMKQRFHKCKFSCLANFFFLQPKIGIQSMNFKMFV